MSSQFVFNNNTTVYFGSNKMYGLTREVSLHGKKAMLIIGEESVKKYKILDKVMENINVEKIDLIVFEGITPNPETDNINKAALVCRNENIEVLIALGGGSVIDTTKAVSMMVNSNTEDVWELVQHKKEIISPLPIIAIPTTAATGSEMNAGAIINNNSLKLKSSLSHPKAQPVAAFYNPEFTFSLSAYQTSCGAVDIISHILESGFITEYDSMGLLRDVQATVMNSVIQNSVVAIKNPYDIKARENLMWASAWSLNGFMYENLNQTPICHIAEHILSGMYPVAHGHGIAIILPRWLRYILFKDEDKCAPIINDLGIRCFSLSNLDEPIKNAYKTIEKLEEYMFITLGLEKSFSAFDINKQDLFNKVDETFNGRSAKNVIEINASDIKLIFENCF